MKKVAIVYWSGTGNTEAMAHQILAGVVEAKGEGILVTSGEFREDMVTNYDGIAFGCPSMGAEVLEEGEFQPMWDSVVGKLGGKK